MMGGKSDIDRRNLLKLTWGGVVSLLAGCNSQGDEASVDTETSSPTPNDTPTENPSSTEETTETERPPSTGRIEFVPKNASGDEDWLANPIFDDDKFNGELNYEVNIDEALQHRSIVEDQAREWPEITEIINNFWDKEWREEFWETYRSGNEDIREKGFNLQEYENHESLDKKLVESNMRKFILSYESFHNDWQISSTYRDAMAGILEQLIDPERENILFSPHTVSDLKGGSHGMVWALQDYADHRDNYESEEAYREAKEKVESFLVDTPRQVAEKFDEGSENISESDYTEKGEWEWERFAHFALYDGEGVDRGRKPDEEEMKMYVGRAFFGHAFNNGHSTSLSVNLDKDFALEIADYAMNPSESDLTGSFIKEYSAVVRDMDESGRFDGRTLKLGRDYIEAR